MDCTEVVRLVGRASDGRWQIEDKRWEIADDDKIWTLEGGEFLDFLSDFSYHY